MPRAKRPTLSRSTCPSGSSTTARAGRSSSGTSRAPSSWPSWAGARCCSKGGTSSSSALDDALWMTRRRSTYRSLAALKRDQAVCRACIEAGYPLESLPVIAPGESRRAYMFGQAPGIMEGQERRPWRGRAGQTLRRWLAMEEDEFYATFYCASVTRCYPGKPQSGRGDRTPTPAEQQLCEFWRDHERRLLP